MRKASMVLGIVGGTIGLLFAVLLIFGGLAYINLAPHNITLYPHDVPNSWDVLTDNDFDVFAFDGLNDFFDDFYYETLITDRAVMGTVFMVLGVCTAIAGVLGLVGGLIVKKKNVAAGVLMIIAAVLSFFNIISMVLFVLGGVFALMRDRSKQQQGYLPPYPMPPNYPYPQPPYPPQGYPQQSNPPEQPPQNPPENPQP